jgi:hypothetical protein
LDSDLLHKLSMNTDERSTVVGVFEDPVHANQAITELRQAGFTRIGVSMRHNEGVPDVPFTGSEHESRAAEGALAGAIGGLGLGAATGLGVLAVVIPVVGPAIAGGTLGVVLSNAAAGSGIAGLVGALVGAGLPEQEAQFYQDELAAGRCIITVDADSRPDEATVIVRRCRGYDMSSRPASSLST